MTSVKRAGGRRRFEIALETHLAQAESATMCRKVSVCLLQFPLAKTHSEQAERLTSCGKVLLCVRRVSASESHSEQAEVWALSWKVPVCRRAFVSSGTQSPQVERAVCPGSLRCVWRAPPASGDSLKRVDLV